MRDRSGRLALAGVLALALGAIVAPAAGHAAKLTKTAAGGAVPNATGGGALAISEGLFTQTFSLKGSKVNGKQVLDVNLILNGSGNVADAADDLVFQLASPKGDNISLGFPSAQAFTNAKFDSNTDLFFCNPFTLVSAQCNYLTGVDPAVDGSGTATGAVRASMNSVFKGLNPKGTWTLEVFDADPNTGGTPQTILLGTSTLEVKTGKKFAREGK